MTALDFRSIAYRLWRLRRLIALSAALPLPGLLLSGLFGTGLAFAGAGGAIWIAWIALVLTMAVRFPNGWFDHLVLGLPLGAVFLLSPFAALFGAGPFVGLLLGLLGMAAGSYAIGAFLPRVLGEILSGTSSQTFRRRLPLTADEACDTFLLRPDAQCGLYACGTATSDGIFPVRAVRYRLTETGPKLEDTEIAFFAKVAERDATTQITRFYLSETGPVASTLYEEILPRRRGCLYLKEEVLDHFSVLAALGFWLTDAEGDHVTATLDLVAAASPRALKLLPEQGFLAWAGDALATRLSRKARDA